MSEKDHLHQTLEYYRQQHQQKLEELRPLEVMIRQLERELGEGEEGEEPSEIPLAVSDRMTMRDSFALAPTPRSMEIRPDEFFGMSQSEAAKAYLKKVGRAVSLDDLVTALNKGGAKVGGASPKKTLYVSLMRNPMREFVSPSENHIGLRVFYPGLPKTEKAGKAARGKKKVPRRRNRKAKSPDSKKSGKSGEIMGALKKVLADGQARTKQELAAAVGGALGRDVPKIAVYGTLRSPEFRQADGKYHLAK
jgi:hypothetical protein